MSTVWVTSDLHFSHNNILKFEPEVRQFTDVQDMDEAMILEWNASVKPNDTVYILGDFAFCHADKAAKIARRLNGHKILIEGNHDKKLVQDANFVSCFKETHKYLDINYHGTMVVMFHYAISQWDQCHRGSVHLHGHAHSSKSGQEHLRCRNVGYDMTGKVVSRMDEVIKDALKGAFKSHH